MYANSYETLTIFIDGIICTGADLFLEWRHVCDGTTQCQNGADEIDCHLLEFQKCEPDEFQCRNGMCIPVEFAFDARPDCMDWSDEQQLSELYKRYYDCSMKSTFDCDDRLCRKDQFSFMLAMLVQQYDFKLIPEQKIIPEVKITSGTKYSLLANITKRQI
ncbi:unnamed protein product [Adineta steineri]|uniref:Uncharacterized protein n=1 Tax=Adineta steineri TaxID=433720 RepID=A0A818TD13_9BILA|nr:unnamed protein product [Adineta steineri]CAF3681597.1 unnamed protein product [Adineta steineri]